MESVITIVETNSNLEDVEKLVETLLSSSFDCKIKNEWINHFYENGYVVLEVELFGYVGTLFLGENIYINWSVMWSKFRTDFQTRMEIKNVMLELSYFIPFKKDVIFMNDSDYEIGSIYFLAIEKSSFDSLEKCLFSFEEINKWLKNNNENHTGFFYRLNLDD